MKTEAELIQLLLDSEDVYYDRGHSGLCGICIGYLRRGKLSELEYESLINIIFTNKPTEMFSTHFFFKPNQWPPRKEYLEQLLIKYK
jgi:hypothetical protein